MFEMIWFAVILGIVMVLSSLVTMFIVMRLMMSDKFLDWYIPKFLTASVKFNLWNEWFHKEMEDSEELKEIKRQIFKDVDNFEEA